MNNSVFGKTMENVRNRVDVKLVYSGEYECMENGEMHYISKKDRITKLAKKPNFNRNIIINKELSFVEMAQTKIVLDKPIYVGFAILELSKWLMYDFHYNVMKKKYGVNLKLCYQDTDSLIYEIFNSDFYEDLLEDSSLKK